MIHAAINWVRSQLNILQKDDSARSNATYAEALRRRSARYSSYLVVIGGGERSGDFLVMDGELRGVKKPRKGLTDEVRRVEGDTSIVGDAAQGDVPTVVSATTVAQKRSKKHRSPQRLRRPTAAATPPLQPRPPTPIKNQGQPQPVDVEPAFLPIRKSPSNAEMTRTERMIHEAQLKRDRDDWSMTTMPSMDSMELIDIPMPFRMVESRTSHQDLHNLLQHCPEPQPPLTHKHLKSLQLNEDQAAILMDQVGKMKTGLSRLQEIVKKFDCANKYKNDIDFLVENVGPALAAAQAAKMREGAGGRSSGPGKSSRPKQ